MKILILGIIHSQGGNGFGYAGVNVISTYKIAYCSKMLTEGDLK